MTWIWKVMGAGGAPTELEVEVTLVFGGDCHGPLECALLQGFLGIHKDASQDSS